MTKLPRTPKDPRLCRSLAEAMAEIAERQRKEQEEKDRQPWEGKHKP